jgi:hypothetical protein
MGTRREQLRAVGEQEQAERVKLVARLLDAGARKHEVLAIIARRWGLPVREAQVLVARARALLAESTGQDLQQLLQGSVALYLLAAEDTALPAHTRLLARKRLDELVGLKWRSIREEEAARRRQAKAQASPPDAPKECSPARGSRA